MSAPGGAEYPKQSRHAAHGSPAVAGLIAPLVQVQVHGVRAANRVQTCTRRALARARTDVTGLQIHYLEGWVPRFDGT